jgi:hypothetical protein
MILEAEIMRVNTPVSHGVEVVLLDVVHQLKHSRQYPVAPSPALGFTVGVHTAASRTLIFLHPSLYSEIVLRRGLVKRNGAF